MNSIQRDIRKQRYIEENIERIERLRDLKKNNIVPVPDYTLLFEFDIERWLNPDYYEEY